MTEQSTESSTPVEDLVMRLRDSGRGRYLWRVYNPTTELNCMTFEDYQLREAEIWLLENRTNHPETFAGYELKRVHFRSSNDELLLEAADFIERMSKR